MQARAFSRIEDLKSRGDGAEMPEKPEYVGSVSLIITGRTLDPASVTQLLGITPSESWRAGEALEISGRALKRTRDEGGWKYHFERDKREAGIEFQLEAWAHILNDRADALKQLISQGNRCRLSWFVASGATVSIVIPSELQLELARLGLDWEISIFLQRDSSANIA